MYRTKNSTRCAPHCAGRGILRAATALTVCLAAGASGLSAVARAESGGAWPARPLTIIVPGAPGGTTDIPTRLVAQKLSAQLGQPVIVENKPGSGGILGTQAAMNAAADGYTMVVGNTGSHAINYSVYRKLTYKPGDFVPITDLISFPNVLVVNAASGIGSVNDLIARLKERPGKLAYGSAGIGQTTHLTAELFRTRTGTEAIHVPYRGSTPATTALLAGEITFMFDNLTQALPHIQSGKLRALAVTSERRVDTVPDVPTMEQAGLSDFVVMGWLGFFAKQGTPPAVVARLHAELGRAMKDPTIVARFAQMGGVAGGESHSKFAGMVDKEVARWGDLIRASDLTLD